MASFMRTMSVAWCRTLHHVSPRRHPRWRLYASWLIGPVLVGVVASGMSGASGIKPAQREVEQRKRAHVLVKGRLPHGPPFAIVDECKNGPRGGHCEFEAVITGPQKPAFLANGGGGMRIMADEHFKFTAVFVTGCVGRREYAIAVGVLHGTADRVVAREKDGRKVALHQLEIPRDRIVSGALVYGVLEPLPQAVVVTDAKGRVVVDEHYRSTMRCPSSASGTVGSIG